jgi:hypothetical protein
MIGNLDSRIVTERFLPFVQQQPFQFAGSWKRRAEEFRLRQVKR